MRRIDEDVLDADGWDELSLQHQPQVYILLRRG